MNNENRVQADFLTFDIKIGRLPKAHIIKMHFPIEILRDKIKDLFEASIPKDTHFQNFELGLSRALKYYQIDDIVQVSAETGNGYEEGSGEYHQFINIYDNFVQFLWMITYNSLVSNDLTLIVLASDNYQERLSAIQNLRTTHEIYEQAILMLSTDDSGYMKASRGRLFSLPNPSNKRDVYTDKIDAIVICGCVYLLLHEYGHFHYDHIEDTPTNELEADSFAIQHLLNWCVLQKDSVKWIYTVILGIALTLISCAYVNPTLVSTSYPDIDDRLCYLLNQEKEITNIRIPSSVNDVIILAAMEWAKHFGIKLSSGDSSVSSIVKLQYIKSGLDNYKKNFKL